MATLKTIITIVFIFVCIALSIVILMQEGKNNGLSALSGAPDSYFDRNKGRTKSGKLLKITKLLAVLFLLLSAILNFNFDRPEKTTDTTQDAVVTATPEATATEEATATPEATEVVETEATSEN